MNPRALVWLGLFVLFGCMTFRRMSWGIPLYLLTCYLNPLAYWWGWGVLSSVTDNWSMVAACIFMAGMLWDQRPQPTAGEKSARGVFLWLVVFGLNATWVHFCFADDPQQSWEGLTALWKAIWLVFLIWFATRDAFDVRLMLYSIVLGSAIVGFEVVLEGEGSYMHGRLENVFIAGAIGANAIAAILSLALPLGAWFLFCGRRWEKWLAVVSLVLTGEMIMRCESRGVFLGLIGGAAWLLLRARGRARVYAATGILLGVSAFVYQASKGQGERIFDRFLWGVASEGERDPSVQSRLDFWRQGLKMIADHPLGSGCHAAFRSRLGESYLQPLGWSESRSVHNGYLDVAAGWGVQGLAAYLMAILLAWRRLHARASLAQASGAHATAFLGYCLEAALVVELIASVFGSTLGSEWFFWWIAMALTFHLKPVASATTSGEERDAEETAPGARGGPLPGAVT